MFVLQKYINYWDSLIFLKSGNFVDANTFHQILVVEYYWNVFVPVKILMWKYYLNKILIQKLKKVYMAELNKAIYFIKTKVDSLFNLKHTA